jgi:peptidoglycan/xylan/chitin deacetylase (PgdA/CDA1 family)
MRSRIIDHFYSRFVPYCVRGKTILLPRSNLSLPEDAVLLTFDDGPVADITPRLLQVLRTERVSACFCVVGAEVKALPKLTRKIAEEGHVLANHGYEHLRPLLAGKEALRADIAACDEVLAQALGIPGYHSSVYRPPGGWLLRHVRDLVAELGMQVAPISYFPMDSLYGPRTGQVVIDRCCDQLIRDRGGSIVLHEAAYRAPAWSKRLPFWKGNDRSWVPDGVQQLIRRLKDTGLNFASAAEYFGN